MGPSSVALLAGLNNEKEKKNVESFKTILLHSFKTSTQLRFCHRTGFELHGRSPAMQFQ